MGAIFRCIFLQILPIYCHLKTCTSGWKITSPEKVGSAALERIYKWKVEVYDSVDHVVGRIQLCRTCYTDIRARGQKVWYGAPLIIVFAVKSSTDVVWLSLNFLMSVSV